MLLNVKKPEKQFFKNLIKTCEYNDIPVSDYEGEIKTSNISFVEYVEKNKFDFIIDSIFGFSFKPPIRAPYDSIINELKNTKIPILSVDIPSGWDVEKGFFSFWAMNKLCYKEILMILFRQNI